MRLPQGPSGRASTPKDDATASRRAALACSSSATPNAKRNATMSNQHHHGTRSSTSQQNSGENTTTTTSHLPVGILVVGHRDNPGRAGGHRPGRPPTSARRRTTATRPPGPAETTYRPHQGDDGPSAAPQGSDGGKATVLH